MVMIIELKQITIKELVAGYTGEQNDDVLAFGGKLNARPVYQRNFVYNKDEKESVIQSILKGFPLNVMYWVDCGDETYELLDGQQRTLSICEYVAGNYSITIDKNPFEYHTLYGFEGLQKKIDDYQLQVYVCKNGTDKEKMDWFETINIAGKPLEKQELRNAIYKGTWVNSAKTYFSKSLSPAKNVGQKYIDVKWDRQAGLEKVIDWHKDVENITTIEYYMVKHQHDSNAIALWNYYNAIITWIESLFTTYHKKEMVNQNWGKLYNTYANNGIIYDPVKLDEEITSLMEDSDVENKKGIYEYIFNHNKKHLSLRVFDDNIKRTIYTNQKGICPHCKNTPNENKKWKLDEMEGDHIIPWVKGGKTTEENCQMLCREHNRIKSDN
jgi:uncharacterized protein with ParB-like and HNH nuclease domain